MRDQRERRKYGGTEKVLEEIMAENVLSCFSKAIVSFLKSDHRLQADSAPPHSETAVPGGQHFFSTLLWCQSFVKEGRT